MDFGHSDTQQMLIDSVDRFMRERAGVEQWRARRALDDGLDREAWSQFAAMGWLALAVPEDAGGLGGSLEDVALLMIALGKGLAIEPVVSSAILGATLIDGGATGESRASLLGAIAEGQRLVALAHDEAGDRYDVGAPRTVVAARTDRGFILNGEKILSLDAPSADTLLVTATIEGEVGIAIFLIDKYANGVVLSNYPFYDGSRGADVHFSAVEVSTDALLASGAAGTALLRAGIDRASVALMAQAVGAMEASTAACGEYARTRKQFGQSIGGFQAIQHLLADMFVASYKARSALYQALAHAGGSAQQRSHAVSTAKVMVAEASRIVGRNGIQIHGAYGVTDEYAISHYYRRLLVLEKLFGDVEYHANRIADAIRDERGQPAV